MKKLSKDQLEVLIPGGTVNKHMARQMNALLEVMEESGDGLPMVVRQMAGNTVYQLYKSGDINEFEVQAAIQLRYYHDKALFSGITSSWTMPVDNASGTGGEKGLSKIDAVRKYQNALVYLGPALASVAMNTILEKEMSYKELGFLYLPGKRAGAERTGAAKVLLKMVCQQLAMHFTGMTKDDQTKALFT